MSPRVPELQNECLFKRKEGPVQLELWGSKIGWEFGFVEIFRWEPSTREPGAWQRTVIKREDIQNLKKCVDALAKWQKLVAKNRLLPFKRPKNL